MTISDEQLVERYLASCLKSEFDGSAGERRGRDGADNDAEDAIGELVRRLLPRVRRIVFPMLLNDHEADEVTQEAMIKMVRGLKNFDRRSALSTWVSRIAINAAYTRLTSRHRAQAENLPPNNEDKSYDTRPEHAAIGRELDARITQALSKLSPKLRAAIVLTVIDRVSVADASEAEECSVSTMHWRIHEARKQLREQLQDDIGE